MVCCRCNRAGLCRGCACVKAKRPCVNCLPSKQGHCANISTAIPNVTSNALAPSTSTTLSRTSRIHCSTSTSAVNTLPTPITLLSTDSVRAVNTALAATPPTTSTSTPISAPRSSENTFAQQQPPTGNTQPAIVAATQWPVPDQDPRSLEPPNFSWGEHSGQVIYMMSLIPAMKK
jgi:hypothetical protein